METIKAKKIKVNGIQSYTATNERIIFDVADIEGHKAFVKKDGGTNKSSGDSAFLNDAKLVNFAFSDLVNGNGQHQGYTIVEKDGDTAVTKMQGKTETKMLDGNPVSTFEGTFSWTKGTGIFKKLEGSSGVYKGRFTSETTYDINWEGEF